MTCLAGAAISYVMLGLASELWMIYAARAFAGLMAGNLGVASAMMGSPGQEGHSSAWAGSVAMSRLARV